jgi:hypothetical protein
VRELEQIPVEGELPAASVVLHTDRLPRPHRPVFAVALKQVARLARSGETQAVDKLYCESQDSSRLEAQQVVERLRLDPQAQPDWVVEPVLHLLQSTQAPEVKKPGHNRGNWVTEVDLRRR